MKKFINCILLLSLFILSLDAKELEQVSLQLNWKYQFEFAGFITAVEKGFYKEEGIDLTLKEYEVGTNVVKNVVSGKSTFGVASSSIIIDYLNNEPIVLISSIFKKSALVIVTQPSIKTPHDLIGKTLMTTKPDITELNFMFESQQVDPKTINLVPHTFNIKDFAEKKVDAMSAYKSDQLYKLDKMGIKYNILDPTDYGLYSLQDEIFTTSKTYKTNKDLVDRFNRATIKGWRYALKHKDEIVDIIDKKYSHNISKDELRAEADVIENIVYPNRYEIGSIDKLFLKKQFKYFKEKYNTNSEKTFNGFLGIEDEKFTNFTKEEKNYLKNKENIRVCYDKTFIPFVYKKRRKYEGVSKDFLDIISKETGMSFSYVEAQDWVEQINYLQTGKCDTIAIIITKPNYYKSLTPSIPYASDYVVLVTKIDEPYFANLDKIKNKTIGIKYGFSTLKRYLELKYPHLNFIYIKSKPYDAILDGKIFGYVTISLDASSSVLKYYSNQLKITIKVMPNQIEGGFGVSNHEPLLLSIFNKVIENIPEHYIRDLLKSYYDVNIEKQTNWKFVIYSAIIFIIIISIVFFFLLREKKFNLKLEKEILKATYDLKEAQKIAKLGFWRLEHKTDKLFFSDNIYEIFEIDKKEDEIKTNKDFLKFIYLEDALKVQKAFCLHIELKQPYNITHRIITKNNEIKFIEQRCETTFIDECNATISVGTIQDVSERKMLEQQLLQQTRLAQMGEMISMIAHQWRQPLSAISSSAMSINIKAQLGTLNNEIALKSSEDISNYSQHLSSTIDDFRDFFSPNREKQDTTYTQLLDSVLSIIETSIINKNIEIYKELNSNITFHTYTNEMKQVILNILKNAEDILLEKKIQNPKITIKTYKNIIEISDNAGGVPKDIIDKIFDPYFSTKETKNGTGLGLYMSKTIIEEHCNGRLSVSNNKNGAIFKIEI